MEIKQRLNEVLVKLFRNVNNVEEQAMKTEEYKDVTTNDMHVIEAIGMDCPRNMTAVAKTLGVTTGTLTISVNSLVKKGLVERSRSEEDRRVVLVSLSEKGEKAYIHHQKFHAPSPLDCAFFSPSSSSSCHSFSSKIPSSFPSSP